MARKLDPALFNQGHDNLINPSSLSEARAAETNPDAVEAIPITQENVNIEIIIKALTAFVFCAGSYPRTIEACAEMGYGIRRDQLKSWSQGEYAHEYKQIRDNFARESEGEMVAEMRDVIRQAADAERLAIERTIEGLSKPISGKDASQAAFNLARVKKENVDKLQVLLGRPTQIVDDKSAEKAIQRLVAKKIIRPITEDAGDDDSSG